MKMRKSTDFDPEFKDYVAEALAQPIHGWDFSYLMGRLISDPLPWNYDELARGRIDSIHYLLDMGTGGGEWLSDMLPLPHHVVAATESYFPNLMVAAERLHSLGAQVVAVEESERYTPFKSDTFELILNRHESYHAGEIFRLLTKGGILITQQVGGNDNVELNRFLQGDQINTQFADWQSRLALQELENEGFKVIRCEEVSPRVIFKDIAAVIFYLRIIAWQIEDFTVERYYNQLYQLHLLIQKHGGFRANSHRFLIEAVKP